MVENADVIEGGGEAREDEAVEEGGGEVVENADVIEGNGEIVDAGENREVVNLDVILFNEDLELFNAMNARLMASLSAHSWQMN